MYSVFIQWKENSIRHSEFDGGLEQARTPSATVKEANVAAAEWLFSGVDNDYYWYPFDMYNDNRSDGLQLGEDDTNIVIDFNSSEPASVDFGDGTIYVAEVVE